MTPLRPFPYLLESHFGVLLPHLPLTADLARPLSTSAFCTDLNRKLAFAKDHEHELAAVGAGKDFQAKFETKLRALETNSGAQEAAIASLPDNTAPSGKPKAASTSSSKTSSTPPVPSTPANPKPPRSTT